MKLSNAKLESKTLKILTVIALLSLIALDHKLSLMDAQEINKAKIEKLNNDYYFSE